MLSMNRFVFMFLFCAMLFSSVTRPAAAGGGHHQGESSQQIPSELVSPSLEEFPHIFLIHIDTLRHDHTSLAGYDRDTTPNLSKLSEQGYLFTEAKSQSSWTMPAVSSLLWGLYPFNHGNLFKPDDDNVLPYTSGSLIETFKDQGGYYTLSIQRNRMIGYIVKDFDETSTRTAPSRLDEDAVKVAASWLDNNLESQEQPFFMFLGLFNPHWPYTAAIDQTNYFERYLNDQTFKNAEKVIVDSLPDPSGHLKEEHFSDRLLDRFGEPGGDSGIYRDGRMYVAAYDASIRYTDIQLGKLFEKLKEAGIYDSSLIIVTSDHGEIMLDHNANFRHGTDLLDAELAVPLVIKFPYQRRGKVVKSPVRTFDLLPTILDWLKLEIPSIDARSILPYLQTDKEINLDEHPVISFVDHKDKGEIVSIYREDKHLIRYLEDGTNALYDLNEDFQEQKDLAEENMGEQESIIYTILCATYCD
ncbi:MAG: sulfatase-like hydrolase/transferase [Magnetococcales bacterium]|nr:sulfatase-like hydrolase/transferase [Magnetococcales bacterium]